MRAVVFTGPRSVAVQDVEDAELEEPTDAVVRITSSAMCGSDLHMYDGRTGARPGMVLGHESMGVVEQVGPAVQRVRVGERVVLPTHLYCGVCVTCARGDTAACLRARDDGVGAAYGYAGQGTYRGGQAELLRVRWADANCVTLPGEPGDAHEDDFVLLADAFVSGWHATRLADVAPGVSVAVFGAGTIGLLAAYAALIQGASPVYVVDAVDARLDKAGELGAVPIDFHAGDPVEQVRDHRRGMLPPGERQLDGVDRVIDAVGFQAHDRSDPSREDPRQVVCDAARLVNPTGAIGIAGVYAGHDDAPAPDGSADGTLAVPWATFFSKGVAVRFGRTHDRRYTVPLRDMVVSGRAHPGRIVTHHAPLEEAPALYDAFDRRADGVIKAVLRP